MEHVEMLPVFELRKETAANGDHLEMVMDCGDTGRIPPPVLRQSQSHRVVSLPAAACLNFHYSDPDERSWVVSPGRRVSSDVVTLELRAPSAPCVSLAVLLLQLLAPLHPTVFAAPHFPTVSSPHPPSSLAHHPVVCDRVTDSPELLSDLPFTSSVSAGNTQAIPTVWCASFSCVCMPTGPTFFHRIVRAWPTLRWI